MEEWRIITDWENYEVSNLGKVRNKQTLHVLKPFPIKEGYLLVRLYRHGTIKAFLLHRLVALAFVPNPMELPEVNHENGIKADCSASNLTWMTRSDQQRHALRLGLRKRYGVGVCFDNTRHKWLAHTKVNGKFKNLGRFESLNEALLARSRFINELEAA